MKTVFIFVTHTFSAKIKRQISRISKHLEGEYPFIVFYDSTAQDVPDASDVSLIPFDYQEISAQFPHRLGKNVVPGNGYVVHTELLKQFPAAANFWIVEYDLRFSGNWREFLKSFDQNQADFLGCRIRYRFEHPDWVWWPSFQNRLDPAINLNDKSLIDARFWISRYSRRALETIRRECAENGWSGHCEVLVPSLLLRAGLQIEEIGGDGRFTPAPRRNRFYSSGFGSMRFRPPLLFSGFRKNRLYHPVKEKFSFRDNFRLLLKYKLKRPQELI